MKATRLFNFRLVKAMLLVSIKADLTFKYGVFNLSLFIKKSEGEVTIFSNNFYNT